MRSHQPPQFKLRLVDHRFGFGRGVRTVRLCHKEAQNAQMNSASLGLTAGGSLPSGGSMEAEAGAHALLPGALLSFAFFNLRPDV